MTEKQLAWTRWYEKASQDPDWQERRRAAKRAEYIRARSKRLATAKKWAENNRDKTRAICKRFYQNHIDAERQRSNQREPAKRRAAVNAHRLRNLAKYAARERERRALKLGCSIGPVDYDAVIRDANGRCGICDESVGDETTHIDHIVPLARGGSHTQANLQLAHARCNLKKGARLVA